MILTDELDLCDDEKNLSKKEQLLKIGKFIGVQAKTCDEIKNSGCNMADIDMEGRKLMQTKQIFKAFPYKIAYPIYP